MGCMAALGWRGAASPAEEPPGVANIEILPIRASRASWRVEEPPEPGLADFVDLGRLRELLTCGDLVLVKATYLMELAAAKELLPRRQDLPQHAVCDSQMLDRALAELEALTADLDWRWHALAEAHFPGIVTVSYAWGSREHPDPGCQLLREVLAPAFEWYLSERAAYLQRGGFDGKCHS